MENHVKSDFIAKIITQFSKSVPISERLYTHSVGIIHKKNPVLQVPLLVSVTVEGPKIQGGGRFTSMYIYM